MNLISRVSEHAGIFQQKMAQNEIEEMLDHLRRIKSGGNISSVKIDQIKKLEMVLRDFRTFIKYHHVLFPDSLVKLTKNAKSTAEMLHWVFDGIPNECKTNLYLERLESHLLELFEGNSSLSYNCQLNDFDLSEYMNCLGKNLNDLLMMFLERGRSGHPEENLAIHRSIKQLKIVQKKMKLLRYLYATEINGYVNDEKLEYLETRIQFMSNNMGQLCLAVSVIIVADFEDDTDEDEYDKNEDDISNKPPSLLCLIVLAVKGQYIQFQPSEWKGSRVSLSFSEELSKFASLGSKTWKPFHQHLRSLITTNRGKSIDGTPFHRVSELRLLKVLDLSSHSVDRLSSATFKQ